MIPPTPQPKRPVHAEDEPEVPGASTPAPQPASAPAPQPAPARPVATLALVLSLGAIFAVEMLIGGAASPTLIRMGANDVALTRAGEVERLLAASTLHVAPWHAFMNLYVLWVLGRQLEALFGRSRFLVIYFASAVGGGIGTTLMAGLLGGAGVSAGASGAIWGLLTASAVLAFRPPPGMPAQMIAAARRAALINLGINVAISFAPGIDRWAHFGGGIVGVILVGAQILVPPRWTLARTGQPDSPLLALTLRIVAGILIAATVVSVAVAWVRNRPFDLLSPPTLVARALPGGGTLRVPSELGEVQVTGGEVHFGNLERDRLAVYLVALQAGMTDPAARDAEVATAAQQLLGLMVPGGSPLGPSESRMTPAGPVAFRGYTMGNDVELYRVVVVGAQHEAIFDVAGWTAYGDVRGRVLEIAGGLDQL